MSTSSQNSARYRLRKELRTGALLYGITEIELAFFEQMWVTFTLTPDSASAMHRITASRTVSVFFEIIWFIPLILFMV